MQPHTCFVLCMWQAANEKAAKEHTLLQERNHKLSRELQEQIAHNTRLLGENNAKVGAFQTLSCSTMVPAAGTTELGGMHSAVAGVLQWCKMQPGSWQQPQRMLNDADEG